MCLGGLLRLPLSTPFFPPLLRGSFLFLCSSFPHGLPVPRVLIIRRPILVRVASPPPLLLVLVSSGINVYHQLKTIYQAKVICVSRRPVIGQYAVTDPPPPSSSWHRRFPSYSPPPPYLLGTSLLLVLRSRLSALSAFCWYFASRLLLLILSPYLANHFTVFLVVLTYFSLGVSWAPPYLRPTAPGSVRTGALSVPRSASCVLMVPWWSCSIFSGVWRKR